MVPAALPFQHLLLSVLKDDIYRKWAGFPPYLFPLIQAEKS